MKSCLRLFLSMLAVCVVSLPNVGRTQQATSSGPSDEIQEIVVTAQKRSERLVDVPIAVSNLTAAQLQSSGVTGFTDLAVAIPGLSFTSTGGFASPRLRGVGSSTGGPGIEQAVAVYVDGVYYASDAATLFNFNELNLDQITVLKGPQGTLFGRNATGGVVQITTREPSADLVLEANAGYGNYNTKTGAVYVAGGLADHLLANFAVRGQFQGDGYGTNLVTGNPTQRQTRDFDARSKIVFEPSEDTKATLAFDFANAGGSLYSFHLPQGSNPAPPTGPAYNSSNPLDIDADSDTANSVKSGGLSLTFDQGLGAVRLRSITAYRRLAFDEVFDLDVTPTPFEVLEVHERDRQFSEELQLQSAEHSAFNWTAGLYYFNALDQYAPQTVLIFLPSPVPYLHSISTTSVQRIKALAGFAQADYEILPQTTLTVGVRYSHERRELEGVQTLTLDTGFPIAVVPASASKSFGKPTFRVSLAHHFTPDSQAYVSFNRGFKSGGFNAGTISDPPFDQEILDAYEVGYKSELLDRRVRFNAAGFYYNYKNIQIQKVENGALGIVNGAAARLFGADADISARVYSTLTLTLGATYLNTKFTSFPIAPISSPDGGVPVTFGSAAGNQLPLAPHFTGTLSADYTYRLSKGSLLADATVSYNSGFVWQPDNFFKQGSYKVINAQLKWLDEREKLSFAIWGHNLSNTYYETNSADFAFGNRLVSYAPPRTYGFTAGYKY